MDTDNSELLPTETHPWEPFIPDGAKVLIMGPFPPGNHRWSMEFYYPNRTNDFWFMIGHIFLGDRYALYDRQTKLFDLEAIKSLMTEKHIALNDTARKVRRLKGNASDKYLDILEPVPLHELLAAMPDCHAVATTGEKAAGVIASIPEQRFPEWETCSRLPTAWRYGACPPHRAPIPSPLKRRPNITHQCSDI